MEIDIDLDIDGLSEKLLGSGTRNFLCTTLLRYFDKYIPKGTGTHNLAGSGHVEDDGRVLVYNTPYAHYQHEGIVLTDENGRTWVGRGEKKPVKTNRKLEHPNGGYSRWDEVAMSNHKEDVVREIAEYIRSKS